jgi:hypothetical protein
MEDKVVRGWRKSSYSGNGGGNCVEVGTAAHTIAVRDTKQDGAGTVLRFPAAAWRRFAGQVKRSCSDKVYTVSITFTDAAGNRTEREPRGALNRSSGVSE